MAWEKRGRQHHYYYQYHRIGGRSVRVYVGSGATAEEVANADAQQRKYRRAEQAAWPEAMNQIREVTEPVDSLATATSLLMNTVQLLAGYHLHDRSWRRRSAAQC